MTLNNSTDANKNKGFRWFIIIITGIVIILWLIYTPEGILGKADAIGYAVCHRIDIRSFHIGERQMPLCARCTGMYLGAVGALVFQFLYKKKRGGLPSRSLMVIFAALVLAWLIDGTNSYIHLFPGGKGIYEPNNIFRLLTGSGMGVVAAAFLFPAFNQTVWKEWDSRRSIENLYTFLPIITIVYILIRLTNTNTPWILYFLAILSASGVFLMLTMIYCMVWLMLLKKDNSCSQAMDLFLPVCAGLGTAVVQIGIFDWVRYLLSGTFSGFGL